MKMIAIHLHQQVLFSATHKFTEIIAFPIPAYIPTPTPFLLHALSFRIVDFIHLFNTSLSKLVYFQLREVAWEAQRKIIVREQSESQRLRVS